VLSKVVSNRGDINQINSSSSLEKKQPDSRSRWEGSTVGRSFFAVLADKGWTGAKSRVAFSVERMMQCIVIDGVTTSYSLLQG